MGFIREYRTATSTEERCRQSKSQFDKNRIPIIVEIQEGNRSTAESAAVLQRSKTAASKMSVGNYLSMSQTLACIRNQFKLTPEMGVVAMVQQFASENNDESTVTMPCMSTSLNAVYSEYKSNDGNLYLIMKFENTYG